MAGGLLRDPFTVYRTPRDEAFIGSSVTGDRPFGFFVGSAGSWIPYNVGGGDPLLSAVAPPGAWGHEYAAVPYPQRYDGTPDPAVWRIVAESDGTVLSYDPAPPDGAPSTLAKGGLGVFFADEPFVVRSQSPDHRFHLSMLMTGADFVQPPDERAADIGGRGDPELIAVSPPEEYGSRFAFMTDHSYPDTFLVLTQRAIDGVFADVVLDCAGVVDGWRAIGHEGLFRTISMRLSGGPVRSAGLPVRIVQQRRP